MALFQRRRSLRRKGNGADAPLGLVVPARAELTLGEPRRQPDGSVVRDVLRDELVEREMEYRKNGPPFIVEFEEDEEGERFK